MSAAWVLLGAQVGVNILQFGMQRRAASARAGLASAQAEFSGTMERMQMRRRGEVDSRQRTERLAQTMGSQRAALGAAGVAGGRTARLLEMRSQVQRRFAQDVADENLRMGVDASRIRQRSGQSAIRAQARQARTQATLNLLGSAVDAGQQAYTLREQDLAGLS